MITLVIALSYSAFSVTGGAFEPFLIISPSNNFTVKKLLTTFLLFVLALSLSAQLRLNVAGDAKITGQLDLSSPGSNLFIGVDTGESNTTGTLNTFLGLAAGAFNTEGESNVFIGAIAGFSNTTGMENIFIGRSSGQSNSTGNKNTFVGMDTGRSNSIGVHNTFVGNATGESNTEGFNNTFIGHIAGNNNTEGANNTFIGDTNGTLNTTGQDNTFLGAAAGFNNTTGNDNTFAGRFAGLGNITGSDLTAFGSGSGASLTRNGPLNNSFAFGSNSRMLNSHYGVLGNISMQQIGGYVNWGTASDGRMKKAVKENIKGLDFILQLRPVSYQVDALKLDKFLRQGEEVPAGKEELSATEKVQTLGRQQIYESYLREKSAIRYTGFIAQEVEQAMGESDFEFSGLVKPAHDQDHYSLRYAEFVVPLVKGMQEQQQIIENLQTEVTELKALVQQLLADKQEAPNGTRYQLDLKQKAMLAQNRPNPFLGHTVIDYFIPGDVQKALIRFTSADGKILGNVMIREPGKGQVNIKTDDYPAGTYFYALILDGKLFETKRMVLTR